MVSLSLSLSLSLMMLLTENNTKRLPSRIGHCEMKIIPFETAIISHDALSSRVELLEPHRPQRRVFGHFVEWFSFAKKEPP